MADLSALARLIVCTYCGAQPGQPCLTRIVACRGMSRRAALTHYGPTGTSSYHHADRTRAVWAIYDAGRLDGVEYVAGRLERAAGMT